LLGGSLGLAVENKEISMKVSDILRVKGGTLFTTQPEKTLSEAAALMAELDVGSLVVLEGGSLAGMLTFREVIAATVRNGGSFAGLNVRSVMEATPMSCGPDTDLDEVRRMMLQRHARYMPVLDASTLVGVVSFYDVAKAVVESQDFENRMLKAYIRDWPSEEAGPAHAG
jgi:CBS domain-containing protein